MTIHHHMQPQRTEKSYGTPGKQVNLDHRLLEAVYSESSTLQNELPSLPVFMNTCVATMIILFYPAVFASKLAAVNIF